MVLGHLPGSDSPVDPQPGAFVGMVLTIWSITAGQVCGVEVPGLVVVSIGDRRAEPARQLLLVDDRADPEQLRWLLDAFQGRLGGPLRDLAAPSTDDLGFCQLPVDCWLAPDGQTITAAPWVSASLIAVPDGEEDGEEDGDGQAAPPPLRASGSCWIVDSVSWATEGSVSWPERALAWDLEGSTGVFGRFRLES